MEWMIVQTSVPGAIEFSVAGLMAFVACVVACVPAYLVVRRALDGRTRALATSHPRTGQDDHASMRHAA